MKLDEPECVKMKRRGAAKIYRKLKDMTPEERSAYWQKRSAEFDEWLKDVKAKRSEAREPAKTR